MNTELLRRILGDARDNAATPSLAMQVEDLARDLEPLATILDGADCDEPMDLAAYVADFKALAAHVKTQPFDTEYDDIEGHVTITDLTPGAFEEWIGELERLAQ